MSKGLLERFFTFIQTIIFLHIGNKFPTNSLKRFMDRAFIIVEKVGSHFPVFSSFYLSFYEDVVEKEITMA